MDAAQLWHFLLRGYCLTVVVETPILLPLLSRPHSWRRRLLAGVWLTACTYPIVALVLPLVPGLDVRWKYLLVAETFAPLAECAIFAAAFQRGQAIAPVQRMQDFAAIIVANLASFAAGEWFR
jgi:hypothetical protein